MIKRTYSIFFLIFILFLSCDKDTSIDSSKETATDPIADITFLGNSFYATNEDNSNHAGPQIVLYRFFEDGSFIQDMFDLDLNGQDYLAIANDGSSLYLQSSLFNSIIKCSPVGEIYFQKWFVGDQDASGCGICYAQDQDSLCILVRNQHEEKPYKLYFVGKDNPANSHLKASSAFPILNEVIGAYALEQKNQEFFILGQDTTDMNVIIHTTLALDILDITYLGTDSITGLCFKNDQLYFGYSNKTIMLMN